MVTCSSCEGALFLVLCLSCSAAMSFPTICSSTPLCLTSYLLLVLLGRVLLFVMHPFLAITDGAQHGAQCPKSYSTRARSGAKANRCILILQSKHRNCRRVARKRKKSSLNKQMCAFKGKGAMQQAAEMAASIIKRPAVLRKLSSAFIPALGYGTAGTLHN